MTNPDENLPVLSDEQIDAAVTKINELVAKGMIDTAVKVGEYILKTFFDNNVELASSKDPTKAVSYRSLLSHKDLNISVNHLNQVVRIAIQEKILPNYIEKQQLKLLSYSHRVELLQIEDVQEKADLAKQCIDNKMSVRDLRKQIKGTDYRRTNEIIPFNPILTDILHNYSDLIASDKTLQSLSFSKISRMKSNIDEFLKSVDEDKAKLESIKDKINPIYEAKKFEIEQPKKPKKRGRPSKKNVINLS